MAEPRPAATVVLLRDGERGIEVWLQERGRAVGFMPSAWVFPGGRVDAEDTADAPDPRIPGPVWGAVQRELFEEASVRVAIAELRPWARWITPLAEPKRFDTYFFVARLPVGANPTPDGSEAVAGAWFELNDALARIEAGSLPVAPPTLRTIWEMHGFATVDEILAIPRALVPCCPAYHIEPDGTHFVLLPGDPDHPSADAVEPPHRYAFVQGRWWARG